MMQAGHSEPVPRDSELGEAVELLDGGAQAYPRMLAAIAQARTSIHLEVYAFFRDRTGVEFIEALAAAARRGVHARVVIDGWGSGVGAGSVLTALRAAGCDARIYNPLLFGFIGRLRRNHRKLLLVDDRVAFIGGINIGDQYVGDQAWADLAVEIVGPAVADLGRQMRREARQPARRHVRILLSWRGGGRRLRRRYVKAFRSARSSIFVAHGYFIPDRGLLRAITAAARRGVTVTVLLPGRSDVPLARFGSLMLYRRLLAAGARLFELDATVLHAKLAVVDGHKLLVGSFNLDPLSLANLETLAEVDDPEVAHKGEAWVARQVAKAQPVDPASCRPAGLLQERVRRWLGMLAQAIAVWVRRLLSS
jgi:cardiolipin synthase